jgi:hypothetical protein
VIDRRLRNLVAHWDQQISSKSLNKDYLRWLHSVIGLDPSKLDKGNHERDLRTVQQLTFTVFKQEIPIEATLFDIERHLPSPRIRKVHYFRDSIRLTAASWRRPCRMSCPVWDPLLSMECEIQSID